MDTTAKMGKCVSKMIDTSQSLQLITGTYRMSILDHLSKALESGEGEAILKSHMTVHRRIGRDIDDFLSWVFWPLAACMPEWCVPCKGA